MEWYPWFLKDYRRDTRHLGLAEDGAYRRLIDEYMGTREPIPDNDAALAAIVRVGLDDWLAVAPVVRKFFRPKDGFLFHKRCDQELRSQQQRILRNSEKGKKAAFARWCNPSGKHARALHQDATLTKRVSLTSSESVSTGASDKKKPAMVSADLVDVVRQKGWA